MPRTQSPSPEVFPQPRIDQVVPAAALPLGEIELIGVSLGPHPGAPPQVLLDGQPAHILMSRPTRIALQLPEDAASGQLEVRQPWGISNPAALRVARRLSEGLHPVTSPAVSRSGMIYATISGPRGKQMPVSVVRVSPGGRGTPFVTGILNATGLAISPSDDLFVTSRAEGNVYRVDALGEYSVYVEGMGVATGAVFDQGMQAAFPVGGVIPGFSEGLQMMAKTGIARFCVPAALGYGAQGTGPIPANADLVFQVELVDYKTAADIEAMRKAQQAAPAPADTPTK